MKNKLVSLLIINTFVLIFFNFAHPVTPEMLQDKDIVASYNGIFYALMSLGMVVGSPFWARKLTTIKSNSIIIVCLIGYAVAQIFFGYLDSVLLMGMSRLFSGIFAGGWIVLSTEYINQHTEENNKLKYLAYLIVSNSIAAIIGQLISGYLGNKINIYNIFIIQAIGLLLITVFVNLILENIRTKEKKNLDQKIKLKRNVIISMITIMLFSIAYTAYNSQVGYYISDVLNGTTLNVAQINSFTSIIMLVTNVYLINKIASFLKHKYIILLQSVFAIIGVIAITTSSVMILFGVTLFLLGVGAYKPSLQKYALDQGSNNSAMIIAYLNSFNALGMVLGSVLSGYIYIYNPIYIMYFILGCLIIIFIIQMVNMLYSKGK